MPTTDGMGRRLGALEAAVERRVEEELEAVLGVLEDKLSREEFVRVLGIVAEMDALPHREAEDGREGGQR